MLKTQVHETNMLQVLHQAVEILKKGGVVAYPTETFYGLGVKFDREDSLKILHSIKQRPKKKGIPLIIGDKTLLSLIVLSVNKIASELLEKFWPGPLTIIFPAKETISEYITGNSRKVAVRIPGESFALQLAKLAYFPITSTSANLSGGAPAKNADEVIQYFGDTPDLIVDGGPTCSKLPSTIVDISDDKIKILREGIIKKEMLIEKIRLGLQ